jgi:hypothetical protein
VHMHHGKRGDLHRLSGWWGHNRETRFDMTKPFDPIPGALGFRLSNPPVICVAALLASLQEFERVDIQQLRSKSLLLTAYLEHLVLTGVYSCFFFFFFFFRVLLLLLLLSCSSSSSLCSFCIFLPVSYLCVLLFSALRHSPLTFRPSRTIRFGCVSSLVQNWEVSTFRLSHRPMSRLVVANFPCCSASRPCWTR